MSLFSASSLATMEEECFLIPKNKFLHKRYEKISQTRRKNSFIKAKYADEVLDHIPKEGEFVNCILKGNFVLAEMLLAMANKYHIKRLIISTLSMSVDNAMKLSQALTDKKIDKLSILISAYFAGVEKIYPQVYEYLNNAGAEVSVSKTHCKVFLLEYDDNYIVFAGSGNLRSSDNVEQMSIFNDKEIFEFYAEAFAEINENLKKKGRQQYTNKPEDYIDKDLKRQIM